MNNLAIRLAEAGRRPEALTAAQEAVELRCVLADHEPVIFAEELERSEQLLSAIEEQD